MTINKHHNNEMGEQHLPHDELSDQPKLEDESRRRFTKSGLLVSGVLMTLASRPSLGGGTVYGAGQVCKTPSGFLSGNISQHGTPPKCSGRTPGYWGTHYTWPSTYKTGTCTNTQQEQDYKSWSTNNCTMYKDSTLGFHCNGYGSGYLNYSMMQVILLGGVGDPYQIGAHCVAALLNARSGWTPVLTEAQVRNIFNEYNTKGYFQPTAGVKWYPADIVKYLQSTMTL